MGMGGWTFLTISRLMAFSVSLLLPINEPSNGRQNKQNLVKNIVSDITVVKRTKDPNVGQTTPRAKKYYMKKNFKQIFELFGPIKGGVFLTYLLFSAKNLSVISYLPPTTLI
jgi:hypothetical protein